MFEDNLRKSTYGQWVWGVNLYQAKGKFWFLCYVRMSPNAADNHLPGQSAAIAKLIILESIA